MKAAACVLVLLRLPMETSLKTFERLVPPNPEGYSDSIPSTRHKSGEALSHENRSIYGDEWKFQNLAHYISQMVCVFTPQGRGEYFNPYWESYTGLSAGQSVGIGWMRAFQSEDRGGFTKQLGRESGANGWEFEARLRRANDGSYRRHLCRCSLAGNQADGVAHLVICCTDVEDWRQAEAIAKEQSTLLGLSLRTHDEEKRKTAHGLQDSAGQYLVALQMKLDGLQRWSIGNTGRKNPIVDECREVVKRCCKEIRTLSCVLYPPLLDDLGLESALRLHVDGFIERTKARVEMDMEPNLGRLDRDLEIALFRVVQEALANIHRRYAGKNMHIKIGGGATSVFVEVAGSGGTEVLPEKVKAAAHTPSGVGVATLRQRIRQAGGLFEIGAQPGGMVIRAVVPRKALVAHACD